MSVPLTFVVFDVLRDEGVDLTVQAYSERRRRLNRGHCRLLPVGSIDRIASKLIRDEGNRDMSDLEDFLEEILPRQVEAETAIHNGDVAPRIAMWSRQDPVTLLGAFGVASSGWPDVSEAFRWVASRFSNCAAYDFELLAAGVSGDLAYTVGYERSTVSRDGGPATDNVLRVTHVYRREDGEWRIVHRHGDGLASKPGAAQDAETPP